MWLVHITLSAPRSYLIEKMASTGSTPMEDSKVKATKEPKSTNATTSRDLSNSREARWCMKAKNFEVFPRLEENSKPSD
jgi:hypothetical protein